MAELLYLSKADVESLLDVDAMLDALAAALVAYSSGAASAPPRMAVRVERGLLGVMPGYVPGAASRASSSPCSPPTRSTDSHPTRA